MIEDSQTMPLFSTPVLGEEAEKQIIEALIGRSFFKDPLVQRRLASYVKARPSEKGRLILELMDLLWGFPSGSRLFYVFRDFDNILGLLGMRSHFIHQFEVFLFGLCLITRLLDLNPNNNRLFKWDSVEKIFFTWLLASTAHDLGYPWSVAKAIITKFADLYSKIHMKNLSNRYRSIEKDNCLDQEKNLTTIKVHTRNRKGESILEIDVFLLDGIQASLNINRGDAEGIQEVLSRTKNHGYASSLILSRTYLEYFYGAKNLTLSTGDWRINALQKAVSAIALHALPPELETYICKISFDSNPFAFILALIDNLQEWSRSLPQNEMLLSYHLIEFSFDGNQIYLSYVLEHDSWTRAIVRRVGNYLIEKKRVIDLMSKPSPPLDFELLIDYSTNHGYKYDQIIIQL